MVQGSLRDPQYLKGYLQILCLNNCSESLIPSRLIKLSIIYSAHVPAVGKGLGIKSLFPVTVHCFVQ